MVKVKNANVGREENCEEGGSNRDGKIGKRKGKGVATKVRLPERFISVKEAANFEEWTRKKRKIAPGHRVDISDMEDSTPKIKVALIPTYTVKADLKNYSLKEKF
ncbi:hypothetical protein M9H77_31772 [Catharanthus roseus]|uniref:Uncharacterized protein n=1 Tax=Catharanthus roseus TaxID=4058 RepID=A0ACC0A229_CATRO|nr:hypothetical protein M9H77_31772 [Catharanthus roseus]